MNLNWGPSRDNRMPWKKKILSLQLAQARERCRLHVRSNIDESKSWKAHPLPQELQGPQNLYGFFVPEKKWREVATYPLELEKLAPYQIAFPHIQNNEMTFRSCSVQELLLDKKNKCLQAPESAPVVQPNVLFVPALMVDRSGNRVGRGGGFYDRYLTKHPEAYTIALVHSDYIHRYFPTQWIQKHDQKVKSILSEKFFIKCQNKE